MVCPGRKLNSRELHQRFMDLCCTPLGHPCVHTVEINLRPPIISHHCIAKRSFLRFVVDESHNSEKFSPLHHYHYAHWLTVVLETMRTTSLPVPQPWTPKRWETASVWIWQQLYTRWRAPHRSSLAHWWALLSWMSSQQCLFPHHCKSLWRPSRHHQKALFRTTNQQ